MKKQTFTLHWLGGRKEEVTGFGETQEEAIADAMRRAGYGGGAVKALDWVEPKEEKQ